MSSASSHNERGATMVVVAISLLALIGMAALAIDGGAAYNERRSTQGAADHAALAAAWAACTQQGEAAAVAAGLAAARANGYDDAESTIAVTVTRLPGSQAKYEAVISAVRQNEFAGVIGQPEMTVVSRAVADCTRRIWGGGYALFADGPPACSAGFELDFTGGGVYIDGQVHSNGDLRLNGNNGNPSTITGDVTLVGRISDNGMVYQGIVDDNWDTVDDPFQIDFARYLPANNTSRWGVDYWHHPTGGTITSSWLENHADNIAEKRGGTTVMKKSGIFFTQGDIKNINLEMGTDAAGNPVRVTFVAGGQISLVGQTSATHYDSNGVLLYSNHRPPPSCSSASNKAIQLSVSSGTWTGLIYAPNGEVQMSMASGTSHNGAVFGYSINLSGSNFTIAYQDVTGGGPEYELNFEE